MIFRWLSILMVVVALTACGGGEEEPTVEDDAEVAIAQPEPTEESVSPEEPAEEEKTGVALPHGFPKNIPLIPGFVVESVETKDAATNQFVVVGLAPMDDVQVMEWYAAKWTELGWDEDMLMEQHGNTIVSFIKDGLLVIVDSVPAPGGARSTITTGSV